MRGWEKISHPPRQYSSFITNFCSIFQISSFFFKLASSFLPLSRCHFQKWLLPRLDALGNLVWRENSWFFRETLDALVANIGKSISLYTIFLSACIKHRFDVIFLWNSWCFASRWYHLVPKDPFFLMIAGFSENGSARRANAGYLPQRGDVSGAALSAVGRSLSVRRGARWTRTCAVSRCKSIWKGKKRLQKFRYNFQEKVNENILEIL